jgi:hypothetical protein
MATNPKFRTTTANSMLTQIDTDLGASPLFQIYAGGQPAGPDTAVTAGNTVVATLAMAASAFSNVSSRTATAGTITTQATAAGGTAAWFSLVKATGLRIFDGSVGTADADLILNAVTITTNAAVSISTLTISLP